jgi:hypothetical protein
LYQTSFEWADQTGLRRQNQTGGNVCVRDVGAPNVGIHHFQAVRASLASIGPSRERHASGRLRKAMRDNLKLIPSLGHGAARVFLPHTAIARRSIQQPRPRAG